MVLSTLKYFRKSEGASEIKWSSYICYAADEDGLGIGFSNQKQTKLFSRRAGGPDQRMAKFEVNGQFLNCAGYSGPSRLIHFHRFLLRFLCWYQSIKCLNNKISCLLYATDKLQLLVISEWDEKYQLDMRFYRRRILLSTLHFPWYLHGAIS